MPSTRPRAFQVALAGVVVILGSVTAGLAQGEISVKDRHGRSLPHHRPASIRIIGERSADIRGLTITKRAPDRGNGENNATVDGPTRYGDISTFDPVPYIDSGLQYPYGFDGIGGFGSDMGLRAGADASLYQRGP